MYIPSQRKMVKPLLNMMIVVIILLNFQNIKIEHSNLHNCINRINLIDLSLMIQLLSLFVGLIFTFLEV